MSEETLREILQLTLHTIALLTAPVIISIVVVGIVSNLIQTVVQIKDQALTFVPKVIVVAVVLVLCIPWYLQTMENYTMTIFNMISNSGGG